MSYFGRLLAMSRGVAPVPADRTHELQLESHEVIEVPPPRPSSDPVSRSAVEHPASAAPPPVIVHATLAGPPAQLVAEPEVKTITRVVETLSADRLESKPRTPAIEQRPAPAPIEQPPGLLALREVFHWVQAQTSEPPNVQPSQRVAALRGTPRQPPALPTPPPAPVQRPLIEPADRPAVALGSEGVEVTVGTIEVTIEEPPRAPVRATRPEPRRSSRSTRLERRLPRGS
ncbi:MAG TPA: hypothetical protein VIV11_40755 [Kofleriaceae bacterium]